MSAGFRLGGRPPAYGAARASSLPRLRKKQKAAAPCAIYVRSVVHGLGHARKRLLTVRYAATVEPPHGSQDPDSCAVGASKASHVSEDRRGGSVLVEANAGS